MARQGASQPSEETGWLGGAGNPPDQEAASLTAGESAKGSYEQSDETRRRDWPTLGLASGTLVRKSSSRDCKELDGVCHKITKHCGACGSCNLSASEELMFIDFLL